MESTHPRMCEKYKLASMEITRAGRASIWVRSEGQMSLVRAGI